MKTYQLQYTEESGWSEKSLPIIKQESSLVLIFAPPKFKESKVLADLKKKYAQAKIIGCSCESSIFGNFVEDHAISMAIMEFDKVELQSVTLEAKNPADSFSVGQNLALALNKKDDLKAVFILSDSLNVNGTKLKNGMNDILGGEVIVTGGLAADNTELESTWIIDNEGVKSNHAVAVGFYGDSLIYKHGSRGGWDMFGPERHITKAEGNIVYEIDGEPALDLYERYLGEKSAELPQSALLFPLQIRPSKESEDLYVRSVCGINREDKSLIFFGDVEEGVYAQLMRANIDRLVDGASQASLDLLSADDDLQENVLSIAISCAGRKMVMGERSEEEVEAVLANFPEGTGQIGFYSYGELSPLFEDGPCEHHNQTMTLTAIGEKDAA